MCAAPSVHAFFRSLKLATLVMTSERMSFSVCCRVRAWEESCMAVRPVVAFGRRVRDCPP